MTINKLQLSLLKNKLAVAHLPSTAAIPDWALQEPSEFLAITRTADELSIVCHQAVIPDDVQAEKEWRALKVDGVLDFALTGILSSLLQPLAKANISIFAISTYNTDYLLVKEAVVERAIIVLSERCIINKTSVNP
jgi:hypothetical protein